jgi:hypothetical protein
MPRQSITSPHRDRVTEGQRSAIVVLRHFRDRTRPAGKGQSGGRHAGQLPEPWSASTWHSADRGAGDTALQGL